MLLGVEVLNVTENTNLTFGWSTLGFLFFGIWNYVFNRLYMW